MKKIVLLAVMATLSVHAKGVERPQVSTPQTVAEASQRSAEMFAQIQKENDRARTLAQQRMVTDAKVATMTRGTAEITAKVNYPITVYDPNTAAKVTKQATLLSKIKVPPITGRTVGGLARGLGANLLALAVYDLLGKSVDYVLDPKNNRVVYREELDPSCVKATLFTEPDNPKQCFKIKNEYAASVGYRPDGGPGGFVGSFSSTTVNGKRVGLCIFLSADNKVIPPKQTMCAKPEPEEKAISLDELADKISQKAEQGDPAANKFLQHLAEQALKSGEFNDDILANTIDSEKPQAAPIESSSTQISTKPKTEEKEEEKEEMQADSEAKAQAPKAELPAFCQWASVVCDFIEWVKTPPELKKEPLDIEEIDAGDFNKPYFNFGGSCPAPVNFNISVMGNDASFQFSWNPICDVMIKLRPFIILASYIVAALIIGGVRTSKDG